jgi:hypothetical protein
MGGVIVKQSRGWMMAILIAGTWTTQAQAKPQFAAYEGQDSIQTGRGGTRVTRNGMDFWTTGAPSRRYRITGVITDKKCLGTKLCGDPINRPAIAEAAKAGGGDGVIVLGKSNDTRGMVGSASAYSGPHATDGFGWSSAVVDYAATMLVIKYLPEGADRR